MHLWIDIDHEPTTRLPSRDCTLSDNELGATAMFPVSNNIYAPLAGFYASPMYLLITDDFGNEIVTNWPICEIRYSQIH